MFDATTTRERHMACKKAVQQLLSEGQRPEYRFDTNVRKRLLDRRGSAFGAGILDPDVVNQVPWRGTSQENDTLLHQRRSVMILIN